MRRPANKGLLLLACTFSLGVGIGIGAGDVNAKRASKRNTKVELASTQVKEEVARTLPSGLALVSLTLPSSLERSASKHDTISLHWRRLPKVGRSVVQVLVHKKNGRTKKGWARVELAAVGRVLVAIGDVPAGTILGAQHFRIEQRAMPTGNEVVLAPDYVIGSRVVSPLKSGVSLLSSDLAMPLPILRGTPVRVEVRRGGVVVSTSGVLETSTKVGRPTRVRAAGRVMHGQLVSESTVVVAPLANSGVSR